MTLCNRVDPWGRLHDDSSKVGTVMGNRGILHNDEQHIVRRWTTKAWVACDPNFRGISRKPLFSPGSYSELFFLDEATALSAGHRPCAYCQREKFNAFKAAWAAAFASSSGRTTLPIKEIDASLHAERVARGVDKITFQAAASSLPDGTIIEVESDAYLILRGSRLRWSFLGYDRVDPLPQDAEVRVLTPRSIVQLYASGYRPGVHISADA